MISNVWGNVIGGFTVLILTVFIGIWIWAWRKRHKPVFQRLSEIPMEDSTEPYRSADETQNGQRADRSKETEE